MLEILQQGDLADGRRRHTVVLPLQPNSLDGDDLIGQSVDCLVDDTVRALAEAFTLLVLLQSLNDRCGGIRAVLTVYHVCSDVAVDIVPDRLGSLRLHFRIIDY